MTAYPAAGAKSGPSAAAVYLLNYRKPVDERKTGSLTRTRNALDRPAAEDIAIKALTFLTSDPERLARFLALTGLGPETIRAAAGTPGFLKAVLDHVAGHEELLVAFADEIGTRPETVVAARRLLAAPGEAE
jgi:hypothetical protein